MRPLKIGVSGTTSSGKSSFLTAVAQSWGQLDQVQTVKNAHQQIECSFFMTKFGFTLALVHEAARDLLQLHPGLEKQPQFQTILSLEQQHREQTATQLGAEVVVCDRCWLDNWAHSELFAAECNKWVNSDPAGFAWMMTFDLLLLLNPSDIKFETTQLQTEIDPNRDWGLFRAELHSYLVRCAQESALPFVQIGGTIPERVEWLEQWLLRHVDLNSEPGQEPNQKPSKESGQVPGQPDWQPSRREAI